MLKATQNSEEKNSAGTLAKRLTYIALILTSFAGFYGVIQVFRSQSAMLQSRGLDVVANFILIFLGIAVFIMPIHLRMTWEEWTATSMVREYIVRFSLIVGVLAAFFLILALIVLIITLPARMGPKYLIVPWLVFLAPLGWTVVDMAQKTIKPSLQNFVVSYGLYAFRIYVMLLVQFITILVGFVLFPAGFLLQFLSLYDSIARWGFQDYFSERPLLCGWFNIDSTACVPALITLHVGHLILAALAIKFGPILFSKASERYAIILETIASWLETN